MLRDNVIKPFRSPWVSPIVLVAKKDGSTRFCVDYRKLNAVTKKDVYPLPRIDDTLDLLAANKLFSTLDLASGYWQIRMDDSTKEKTAFTTHVGLRLRQAGLRLKPSKCYLLREEVEYLGYCVFSKWDFNGPQKGCCCTELPSAK